MGRKLPPFAAVRAFEAAARHGNLQDAATELLVSPSAVSHQVKALEAFVGTKMFLRGSGGLKLTEEGDDYLQALCEALDLVEVATIRASGADSPKHVKLNTYLSLAQQWLIPLLPEFRGANPNINVTLVTLQEEMDFSGSDIDLAIRWDAEPPKGFRSDLLFEDQMVPVCSPEYASMMGPIEQPQDLLSLDLISNACTPTEWSHWFERNGVERACSNFSFTLDTRMGTLQAACEGLGVAMARRPYAELMIKRGELIVPVPLAVTVGMAYYLVTPDRSQENATVDRFRSWLVSVCEHSAWEQPAVVLS